ncbi:MAG: nucleotidyltransferase domain-containing protein [bacterium]|nr:nucleotidyltransferase domain-containing protein [bacterium]
MTRRELVLGTHRAAIKTAAAANKATSIALVGSAARGDDGPASDVDFLARFETGSSLFDLARLQGALAELLGVDVDVVSAGGLKPDEYEGHRAMLLEAIIL